MGRPGKAAFLGCRRKRRHETVEQAERAAVYALGKSDAERLVVYACHLCGGFHLSSHRGRGWVLEARKEVDDGR